MSFPSNLQAEFTRAVDCHRRGQLADAERICRAVLRTEPLHFGAQYMLGVVSLQRGDFAAAEQQIALALQTNPNAASAWRDRGVALAQLERFDEALASFDRAIVLRPDYAEALGHRGNVLQQKSRFTEALDAYDKAIALNPDNPVFRYNRGVALLALDDPDRALPSFEKAIALKPDYAAAFNKQGSALQKLNRPDAALAGYDRAVALKPDLVDAFHNRALLLQELGRTSEAVESYDRAIALKPDSAESLNNRANALKDLERFDEALASYDSAIACMPNFAEAFYNRAVLLLDLNRPHEALASYDQALLLKPDYPEARFSRGVCNLALGRMESGWSDYDSRWRLKNYTSPQSVVDAPRWSGEALQGRSILVYAEQGSGDIVQFCRFLPLLAEDGAELSFLAPERLHRLLDGLRGNIRLLASVGSAERFDFQCPLMSLPYRLGTTLADIPLPIPYLSLNRERATHWGEKLGGHGFRIGINWQGALWHGGAAIAGRSIPLAAFRPLSQVPGVRLISLQKNHGIEQLDALPAGMRVETLGEDFDAGPDAFADTVAVMEHLDLVVTCDTSIAHVAGARGRPVWIALKHVPEWRWMLDHSDSPWYPTARLFRQRQRGDWTSVFHDIAAAVHQRVS